MEVMLSEKMELCRVDEADFTVVEIDSKEKLKGWRIRSPLH